MTVTYSADVANASIINFIKTMLRWRGSLWKSIYQELFIWCILYTLFALVYYLALNEKQQITFAQVCLWLYKYGDLIPVTFMLGYYVTLVVQRWQQISTRLGYVDNIALSIVASVEGNSERAVRIRRTIMRYICLVQVLVFRAVSFVVKKRFPTLETLVEAGYIEEDELKHVADNKFWLPMKWTVLIIGIARREGLIKSDNAVQQLFNYICEFRSKVASLWLYHWIPVPLVYTQVVFLCIRLYFILMVLGRQFVRHKEAPINIYVPVLSIIQIIFFIGWSKVAEALLNPFGGDDDDFEMNFIIDRNLQVSMAIVTRSEDDYPPLVKDKFFDEKNPVPLYTLETVGLRQNPDVGSASTYNLRHSHSGSPVVMVKRPSAASLATDEDFPPETRKVVGHKKDESNERDAENTALAESNLQRRNSSPDFRKIPSHRKIFSYKRDSQLDSWPTGLDMHQLDTVCEDDESMDGNSNNIEMEKLERKLTGESAKEEHLNVIDDTARYSKPVYVDSPSNVTVLSNETPPSFMNESNQRRDENDNGTQQQTNFAHQIDCDNVVSTSIEQQNGADIVAFGSRFEQTPERCPLGASLNGDPPGAFFNGEALGASLNDDPLRPSLNGDPLGASLSRASPGASQNGSIPSRISALLKYSGTNSRNKTNQNDNSISILSYMPEDMLITENATSPKLKNTNMISLMHNESNTLTLTTPIVLSKISSDANSRHRIDGDIEDDKQTKRDNSYVETLKDIGSNDYVTLISVNEGNN